MINVIYYVACALLGIILVHNGITPLTWKFYAIIIPTVALLSYLKNYFF